MPTDSSSAKILAAELFVAVRKGLIVGRVILEPENGVPLRYPYDAIPEGCVYSYTDIFVYICIYVYIHVCIYIYRYIHVCIFGYICIYLHINN
jgi:hypothetical protein